METRHQDDGRNNTPKIVFLNQFGRECFRTHDIDGTPPEESIEARVGELEEEVEELWMSISDTRQAIDQLDEAFNRQHARLKTKDEIYDRLKGVEEEQSKQVERLTQRLESLLDSVDELEDRVERVEQFHREFTETMKREDVESE